METGKERIRLHLLTPLALIIVLVLGAFNLGLYSLQQYHLQEALEHEVAEFSHLFDYMLGEESRFLTAEIRNIIGNNDIRAAWLKRDKATLQAVASPLFKEMKGHCKVTHFYFIDPQQVCYLRVHSPDRAGDRIARYTMEKAVMTGKLTAGIELGPLGTFTLRVVQPWVHEGKLIGYLELGEEIEHISPKLKDALGVDLIFTIDKGWLNREKWKEGVRFLGKEDNWDNYRDFVLIDSTTKDHATLSDYIRSAHNKDWATDVQKHSANGQNFLISSAPLIDIGKEKVGRVFLLENITEQLAISNHITRLSLFGSVVLLVCLLSFFSIYLQRVEKRLQTYRDKLEDLVEERTEELQKALDEVKVLSGFLPICSYCKKIRDDDGYWNQLEAYISQNTDALFSHSICSECMEKHHPDIFFDKENTE